MQSFMFHDSARDFTETIHDMEDQAEANAEAIKRGWSGDNLDVAPAQSIGSAKANASKARSVSSATSQASRIPWDVVKMMNGLTTALDSIHDRLASIEEQLSKLSVLADSFSAPETPPEKKTSESNHDS